MIQDLDVQSLLNGDVRRAIHTTRYSRFAVHRVESVAVHTFNTMVYISIIAHHLEDQGYHVNHGVALNKGLWHDTEEPAGTGDILRGVKHSSPQLLQMIEDYGRDVVERVSLRTHPSILRYWETAKDETIEGQIVRAADFISVISYLVEEHDLGNRTLGHIHEEVMEYFDVVIDRLRSVELKDLVRRVRDYFISRVTYPCPISQAAVNTSR